MTEEERQCRKINILLQLIKDELNSNSFSTVVLPLVKELENLIEKLSPECVEARSHYEDEWGFVYGQVVLLQRSEESMRVSFSTANQSGDVDKTRELPRDPLPTWDGEVDLFAVFWNLFSSRVLELDDLDEKSKLNRLISAVPKQVKCLLIGHNLQEAKAKLEKKYKSDEALSGHIVSELSKIKVVGKNDVSNLKVLANTIEKHNMLMVDQKDQTMLKLKTFSQVFEKLPNELKEKFVDLKKSKGNLNDLSAFVNDEVEKLEYKLMVTGGNVGDTGQNSGRYQRPPPTCYICKEVGHISRNCSKNLGSGPSCNYCKKEGHFTASCPEKAKIICFGCNKPGHIAKHCIINKSSGQYGRVEWSGSVASVDSFRDNPFLVQVSIDGVPTTALVDSGSPVSLVPWTRCSRMDKLDVRRFGGAAKSSCFVGKGPVQKQLVTEDGVELSFKPYVADVRGVIIGRDLMQSYKVRWDLKRLCGTKGEQEFTLRFWKPETVGVFSVFTDDLKEAEDVQESRMICKGDRLKKLIESHSQLMDRLGHCTLMKHQIKLKANASPVCVALGRQFVNYVAEMRKNVQEMLETGVIRKSTSQWCSPMVPVRKKNGSVRVCIDYRQLNELTVKDAYPMPRIDVTLERLSGAQVFSKIDLRKGYYQMEVAEEDRGKTAFRFDGQLYEFVRMPFGLAMAPVSFVRLMDMVFADLPFVGCYIDDVIIFSKTEKEHVAHVAAVFERLAKAGLRLNKDKCEFGVAEVNSSVTGSIRMDVDWLSRRWRRWSLLC